MLARSPPLKATVQARLALRKSGPLRLLVDDTVLGHAIIHETEWISTGTKLWGGQVPVETGYTARIPVSFDQQRQAGLSRNPLPRWHRTPCEPAKSATPHFGGASGGAFATVLRDVAPNGLIERICCPVTCLRRSQW